MNAKNSSIVKASFALTSLVVCGAFAIFATSCASSADNGGGGGTSATGGTAAGGTSGGGSTGTAPAGSTVTFNKGSAVGVMTGPGWMAMGTVGDIVTDPVCSTGLAPTAAVACTSTTWNSDTALCTTGTIAALPAAPTPTDYSSNWGIEIGVSAKPDGTSPIGQSFSTIALAISGAPTSGLRVDIGTTTSLSTAPYCATYASGPIPLTSFNTACWPGGTGGTQMTAADVPNITKVMLQVSTTQSPITVSDLCITGITFN